MVEAREEIVGELRKEGGIGKLGVVDIVGRFLA